MFSTTKNPVPKGLNDEIEVAFCITIDDLLDVDGMKYFGLKLPLA
jgi:hypothetical protein